MAKHTQALEELRKQTLILHYSRNTPTTITSLDQFSNQLPLKSVQEVIDFNTQLKENPDLHVSLVCILGIKHLKDPCYG